MKSDYVLPVTLAAISHGVALFAFNSPETPTPAKSGDVVFIEIEPLPRIEMPPLDPAEIVAASSQFEEGPNRPVAEDFAPTSPDSATGSLSPDLLGLSGDMVQKLQPNVGMPGGIAMNARFGGGFGGIGTLSSLDNEPKEMAQLPPQYPHELRRAGIEGSANIEFVVGTDGRVVSARVVAATERAFGEAGVAAVQRWRFQPGLRNGIPVPFRMAIPLQFSITD